MPGAFSELKGHSMLNRKKDAVRLCDLKDVCKDEPMPVAIIDKGDVIILCQNDAVVIIDEQTAARLVEVCKKLLKE